MRTVAESRSTYYIIYDPETLKIVATSDFYNREVHDAAKTGKMWVNITHPKNRELAARIFAANEWEFTEDGKTAS